MTVQLTAHLTLEEVTASATATAKKLPNRPNLTVLGNLMRLADAFERIRAVLGGKPITIHSGFRAEAVNKAVGGVVGSYHTLGLALDFDPPEGMGHDEAQHRIAGLPDLDFDLIMEEGTAKPEAEGGSRWLHFQIPKPGAKGRRLVRDALVDKLGGSITRTSAG
jgi:hypothetical protein